MTPEYILRKSLCRPAHCFSAHVQGKGYVNKGDLVENKPDYDRQRRRSAESEIDCLQWAAGYAEPGYDDPKRGVLFANWNVFATQATDLLELAGYAIEWSDEWSICDLCMKAVRTSPDSYGWTRSYYQDDDGEIICHLCVADDPSDYLQWLEGSSKRAETMGVDLTAHGYHEVNGHPYENGWHPGQNDDPQVIAKSLRAKGIGRFIFRIQDVGQFDVRFSVYVHEDDAAKLTELPESALSYDPGTEMGKALRGEPTEHYTVTKRQLTPEEFVSGDWAREGK